MQQRPTSFGFFTRYRILFFSLILIGFLRLPNFWEPYWYGDEGIYLTIGTALKHGEHLYRDIVDHKTPIIYYLSMVPNQFGFRVLNLVWMIITTSCFFWLAKRFLQNTKALTITMVLFVLLTTLPLLEGNLPNGELFVMGFILSSMVAFWQVPYVKALFASEKKKTSPNVSNLLPTIGWSFAGGAIGSLAVLTKVPALLDVAALGTFGWFVITRKLLTGHLANWRGVAQRVLSSWVALGIGFTVPIVLSVIYFALRGSLADYLNFGLLYNLHYANNWQLGTNSSIITFLFSLTGKAVFMLGILAFVTVLTRKFSAQFQFLMTWSGMALFAALLSNRPYPHYFLQILPPFILLIGWTIQTILHSRQTNSKTQLPAVPTVGNTFEIPFAVSMLIILVLVRQVIGVYFYPTVQYYQNWLQRITGQISQETYENRFNPLIADNRAASKIIVSDPDPYMFIWGTNPMLYAITQKVPVGRFTVSFHIKDLHVIPETFEAINKARPKFIVTMNDETEPFPELKTLLAQFYYPNAQFEHYTLWKRQK